MTIRHSISAPTAIPLLALALALPACGGDDASADTDDPGPASGFGTTTMGSASTTLSGGMSDGPVSMTMGPSTAETSASGSMSQGGEVSTSMSNTSPGTSEGETDSLGSATDGATTDDEPDPPPLGSEDCDAGDEAYVKRLIPFVQGRRPESIREVRLLTSIIEQLDARGQNGRAIVARGLAQGDEYLERWRTWIYEELRINLAGDRRNDECYNGDISNSGFGESTELAEHIRDNTAEAQFPGGPFYMTDVVYSGLRLDDISTIYRADLFARMSAPLIAGNVSQTELEELRRGNFGSSFEQSYLGRTTECLQCHRTEWSITYSADELHNRHFPVRGLFELAVYGPEAAAALTSRHVAIWRYGNFAYPYYQYAPTGTYPNGAVPAFGMGPECGGFRLANPGAVPYADLTTAAYAPYMLGSYDGVGATIYDMDQVFKQGFDNLREDGLDLGDDDAVSGGEGAAYLFAMNLGDRMWIEAMGFPLKVANNFPRNPAQRDVMQHLAETFVSEGFSLRALIEAVASHDYFNQAAPAECETATPYFMPAVFDPFTRDAADPAAQGNGVGDSVHRVGAWPLLDSLARTMWWNKPSTFGDDNFGDPTHPAYQLTYEIPELNCGGDTPNYPCIAEPTDAQVLRDLGAFLSDSETGFEGIDMVALLRLERDFGQGTDPGLSGDCTGPLGRTCATEDWITQLVDVAMATPEAQLWDVAVAVKDRILTQTTIDPSAEQDVLEDLMGESLDDTVADIGAQSAETAARRMAGMLFNSPQFLLEGISAPDQDPADDPRLIVDGTDTESLCNYLAPLILDSAPGALSFDCTADGIEIMD